jgi:hypothetical protein
MLKTMKKSNKLLIIFALASFLIPVIVVAINVKLNYKDAKEWASEAKNDDHFSTPSNNMLSKKLPAFSSVNVNNGDNIFFNIRLIKDANTGVKLSSRAEKLIDFNVDANGKLQVSVKQNQEETNYLSMFIYAPNFKDLELNNINGLELTAVLDSLNLSVKKAGDITFGDKTNIGKLNASATNVKDVRIGENIKSLRLNLNNSDFNSYTSYQDLNISTSGKSSISIMGGKEVKNQINKFAITTIDSASVTISDINIGSLSGSLSDQTTVQMSAGYLKQILKK